MMKSNQTLAILFWHRKSRVDKNGYAPIICRITIDGHEVEFWTAKKVHVDEWDIEAKRAVKGKDFKTVNSALDTIKVNLDAYFLVLRTQYEVITPLMLKNVYRNISPEIDKEAQKNSEVKIPTLLELSANHIMEFTEMVKREIRSKETLKQWRATENKLKEFLTIEFDVKDIPLNEIEYSFALKFFKYLTIKRKVKLGESAAMKQIKNTKQLLSLAETSNWISKNPIEKFRCGSEDPEIIPLEVFEVEKIWRKKISIERLAKVRDAFIFQCFTGFAYQDIYKLSKQHIIYVGSENEPWLAKERGKTKVTEMVPILPIVAEIGKTTIN